jgi:hypothetical protein
MHSQQFKATFDKLATAEVCFLSQEFLAPVIRGGSVRVRMSGVVCSFAVAPAAFVGWGVFRPMSHSSAELIREAGLAEQRKYLELFPSVGLILGLRSRGQWMAAAAHRGDQRLRVEGLVPLQLPGDVQQFDRVRARFDGVNFWFECRDRGQDPATAAYLRATLKKLAKPNQLDRPGLTSEERDLYAMNYRNKRDVRQQAETDQTAEKLRRALGHGGAKLVDFLERKDGYRITYSIGGRSHVCAVDKNGLNVQVAGICLSGRDGQFDLASLVGVVREAEQTGGLFRVGRENHGLAEELYWNAHPPVVD